MAIDLKAIRQQIALVLTPVVDLRYYSFVPDSLSPPCAVIYPASVTYNQTFDGMTEIEMIVLLVSSATNNEAGQNQLDDWLTDSGATSLVQALNTDTANLGATVTSTYVREMRNYGVLELPDGGTKFYSAELVLEILA